MPAVPTCTATSSQGELWAQGTLRLEQPLVDDLDWDLDIEVLTPLGYRPTPDRRAIVPGAIRRGSRWSLRCFSGLGGRPAVFHVVPLLGGLLVWATYQLGSPLSQVGALAWRRRCSWHPRRRFCSS